MYKALLHLSLIFITLTLVACDGDSASNQQSNKNAKPNEQYQLKIATVVSPPHAWIDAAQYLATELKDRTNGAVTLKIHHSGTLGNDERIIDEMQNGTIDFIIGGTQNAAPYLKQFQLFGFAYLFNDEDHFKKVIQVDSPVTQAYQELISETDFNLKLLGFTGGGVRYTSTRKKSINSVSDVNGLKMRLPGSPVTSKLWSELGAVPTSLPFGEIYSALQTGVVNGFESTLSGYNGSKLYEVAPHIATTQHEYMVSNLMMSTKTVEKLPQKYLDIIDDITPKVLDYATQKGDEYDDALVEELKDKGVTFSYPDTAEFSEHLTPLYQDLAIKIDATELLQLIQDTVNDTDSE